MSSALLGSWADAGDEFSAPDITINSDGSKTVVTYKTNNEGKKVKVIQKIKDVKVQEKVHPLIAQRKNWKKFGKELNSPQGPDHSTTQLGERIELRLNVSWKQNGMEEEEKKSKSKFQHIVLHCRTCGGGEHYTTQCPFKEILGSSTINPSQTTQNKPTNNVYSNGLYVPVHLRNKNSSSLGDSKDDTNTLKISQLNSSVTEDMLRNQLFGRYGSLQRVTIVRDRETGASRGFAYVSFASQQMAAKALQDLNGKGYHSLILHLEWSKRKKTG